MNGAPPGGPAIGTVYAVSGTADGGWTYGLPPALPVAHGMATPVVARQAVQDAATGRLALQARWAESMVLPVVLVSLVLCLVVVPQARIGPVLKRGTWCCSSCCTPPWAGVRCAGNAGASTPARGSLIRSWPGRNAHLRQRLLRSCRLQAWHPLSAPSAFDEHVDGFRAAVDEIEAGQTVGRLADHRGNR